MTDVLLYEGSLQVVPLLLIALFLEGRESGDEGLTERAQWWLRAQDRAFALLGVLTFMVSLLVVSGVLEVSRGTDALVIGSLSLAISLLFSRIWRRFDSTTA